MAQKVLIIGASGTGKSHSIQYLNAKSTFVICPDRKELPFKGSRKAYVTNLNVDGTISYKTSNFAEINSMTVIREKIKLIAQGRPDITDVIIDTITYAMIESVMREIKTKGYDKFSEFAQELYLLLNELPALRKDLTVWVLAHAETNIVDGSSQVQFKVPAGKLTSEKIVPEGLFTIVLYTDCSIVDGNATYCFITQNTGNNTGKSPEGMFPSLRIENNLQYVKECIHAYYNEEQAPAAKTVVIKKDDF